MSNTKNTNTKNSPSKKDLSLAPDIPGKGSTNESSTSSKRPAVTFWSVFKAVIKTILLLLVVLVICYHHFILSFFFLKKGNQMRSKGRYEEALESYEYSVKNNEKNYLTHMNMSYVLLKLGRHEEALSSAQTAIRLKPDYQEPYYLKLTVCLSLKKWESVIKVAEQILSFNKEYTFFSHGEGDGSMQSWRPQEAMQVAEMFTSSYPSSAEAHSCMAYALLALGEPEEALVSANMALSLDNKFFHAHFVKGNILLLLERYQEALESTNTALEIEPKSAGPKTAKRAVVRNVTMTCARAQGLMKDSTGKFFRDLTTTHLLSHLKK